jgi:hypothetical protein
MNNELDDNTIKKIVEIASALPRKMIVAIAGYINKIILLMAANKKNDSRTSATDSECNQSDSFGTMGAVPE